MKSPSTNSKRKRIIISVLVILAFLLGGRALMMRKKAALAKSPKFQFQPHLVDTVKATSGELREIHRYLAVIEPFQMADISARVTANIDSVSHWEGDSVKEGEVLASLDDQQVRDAIEINRAQTEQAKAEKKALKVTLESHRQTQAYWLGEKERNEKLAAKGATSISKASAAAERYSDASGKLRNAEQKLFVIDQQIKTLERQLDQLKTTLEYYKIVSPFDGVLSARSCNPGDLASPGKSLFNVEDQSTIKLSFSIPQEDLQTVHIGTKAFFDYGGKTYHASISRIFPKLNRARMVTVEALLSQKACTKLTNSQAPCKALPLGAYVDFKVVFNQLPNAVLIPKKALIKHSGHHEVYVVEKGVLHRREVEILGSNEQQVAVKGIKEGDSVVVSTFLGWAHLVEGMKVEKK